MNETLIGTWIAAFLTLGILSFLYRDNPVYKISEAIFIGASAGYWFITLFWDNIHRKFWIGVRGDEWLPALFRGDTNTFWESFAGGDYLLWGGAILGVMMLFRLSRKIGWIARWPLSFIVGAVAGLYMMLYITSNALAQVQDSIRAVVVSVNAGAGGEIVGSIVIAIGTFSGLVYFYFSKEHKGAFGVTAKVGVWFLMITFGAAFGYTVMSRMSLLIGRIDFLLSEWLQLIG